jgi:hypothetical protein
MTNHSADPNQTYLARIRKFNSFYGTDPEKRSKQMQKSKEFFFRSVFMLKLTTPELKFLFFFYYLRYADPKKFNADPKNFDADPELFYTKRADPKPRIGTKHETVPENVKRMVITSSYGTVPH